MFTISRVVAAVALSGPLLLAGCAGDATLLSKPWNPMRSTAKASKSSRSSESSAAVNPKTGPSDDIPTAASVGLEVRK